MLPIGDFAAKFFWYLSLACEIDFFLFDSYFFFSSSCAASVLIFVLVVVAGPLWLVTGVFATIGVTFLPTSTPGAGAGGFLAVVGFGPIVGLTGGCSKLLIF